MLVKMKREPQILDSDHTSCNKLECPMLKMKREPQISDADHPSSNNNNHPSCNRVAAGGGSVTVLGRVAALKKHLTQILLQV